MLGTERQTAPGLPRQWPLWAPTWRGLEPCPHVPGEPSLSLSWLWMGAGAAQRGFPGNVRNPGPERKVCDKPGGWIGGQGGGLYGLGRGCCPPCSQGAGELSVPGLRVPSPCRDAAGHSAHGLAHCVTWPWAGQEGSCSGPFLQPLLWGRGVGAWVGEQSEAVVGP